MTTGPSLIAFGTWKLLTPLGAHVTNTLSVFWVFIWVQVYKEARNYTQSFMDFQKLGKLMPDNAEVFEELQQAARLCLDSPAAGSQVFACLVMMLWLNVLKLLLSLDLSKAFTAFLCKFSCIVRSSSQ